MSIWCCQGAVKRARAVRVLSKIEGSRDGEISTAQAHRSHVPERDVPSGKSQIIVWDGAVTGLGLRCLSGGAKTWVYVYRAAGGGRAPFTDPAPRLVAGGIRRGRPQGGERAHAGAVAHGRDPAAERREERRRERATLKVTLDDYERSLLQRRLANVTIAMSDLRRGLSGLMKRDVRTLTRADYVEAIAMIERDGRPGAANDLRKHCRTFAEWCVGRGLADHNPLAGLRRPRRSRAERLEAIERGRALDDVEMRRVWQAASGLGSFGGLVQLALLTGMRRGELSGLRWSDIKSDRIVLEAQHTKTGTVHEVPLTDLMREVLARQPRTSFEAGFPIEPDQHADFRLDEAGEAAGRDQRRRPHLARHAADLPHADVAPRGFRRHRRAGHRAPARRSRRAIQSRPGVGPPHQRVPTCICARQENS